MAFGMMEQFGFGLGIVFTLISVLVSAVLLWITAKLFKLKGGFVAAFIVALVVGVVNWTVGFVFGFLPVIGVWVGGIVSFVANILVGILMIKNQYKVETAKGVLVWLVWFVMSFLLIGILAGLFALILAGVGIATGGFHMWG